MTLRRLLVLIVLAALGYGATSFLFPRIHPVARWNQRIDRRNAIDLGRQEAARNGFDTADLIATLESELYRNSWHYRLRDPHPEIAPLLTPSATHVTLNNSGGSRRVRVSLATDGRVIGWERVEPKASQQESPQVEEVRRKAESALEALTGSRRSQFALKSESDTGTTAKLFSWEMSPPNEPRVSMLVKVKVDRGVVTESSLAPVFSASYLEVIRKERQFLGKLGFGFPILLLIGLLIGVIYYFLNIVRKEVNHRSTFTLFAALFVLFTLWNLNGGIFEDVYGGLTGTSQLKNYYLAIFLSVLLTSLLGILFALPFFVLWAAGYPSSSRGQRNPLKVLELLIRGHWRSRLVGESLLVGISFGWVIPLAMLLVAASQTAPHTALRTSGVLVEMFVARFPVLTHPTNPVSVTIYVVFTVYVLLIPLFSSLLRRPMLVRSIGFLIGLLCLAGIDLFQTSWSATFLLAALSMIVVDQLTYRVDLLAAAAALLSGDCVIKFGALLAQPAPSLEGSGIRGWISLVVFMILVATIAVKGKVLDETEARALWTPEGQQANRIEHERLKAEFDVARKAQKQMLPARSPDLPGFEIAAVCQPAREVGGDLYDFLLLPDDKLGIVVADVSGKGVPAALYMTLTKGLLASVAETSSDPGEILREVNRHLHIACGKKMFVTLLLGVIDPQLRTFSYARAGHNPPVWRQKASLKTEVLGGRGLGLGLNAGEIFDRTLTVATIQLHSDDKLFLYSDGITEAMNELRDEYGEARLMEVAARSDAWDADRARDAVLADVSTFLGRTPPQDDQTLVVVRVK